VGKVLFWTFRLLWTAVVIAVPIVGVWVGSSIAAYLDGPIWLVCVAGLLLFPGLPLLWQTWAQRKLSKRLKRWHRQVLTYWDKLILRTLAINAAFLSILLWQAPETAFASLSTRGDWMLDSARSERVDPLRRWLLETADRLQWLYDRAHHNEFESMIDPAALPDEAPRPATAEESSEWEDPWGHAAQKDGAENPWRRSESSDDEAPAGSDENSEATGDPPNPWGRSQGDGRGDLEQTSETRPSEPPVERPAEVQPPTLPTPLPKPPPAPRTAKVVPPPRARVGPRAWPMPATVHPVVASMPASAKRSVTEVGQYIVGRVSDPWERIKVIHDFAATHVAYDAPALVDGRYPPQDADSVLRTGIGVCAGYANLSKAIADVTGDRVVIVVGDSRDRNGGVAGGGHAWNAARVGDEWALFDATWDAGSVDGATFEREYETGYLFAPPAVMGVTHFPDDPAWQLRRSPISRGEFVRQPMMRPRFFHQGFGLISPRRSQVDVNERFSVRLENPRGYFVSATYGGASGSGRCRVTRGPRVEVDCEFANDGTYRVNLFSNDQAYGSFEWLGAFSVHAR
jgi:hypothetical protein